jgi:hypothetical protein
MKKKGDETIRTSMRNEKFKQSFALKTGQEKPHGKPKCRCEDIKMVFI